MSTPRIDIRSRRSRRLPALLLAVALAALGVLSAAAISRGGSAVDDGPRLTQVGVRAIERSFVDDDAGGAPQLLDREVTLEGRGFLGTSFGPFVRFISADGASHEALMVVLESGSRIVAYPPPGLRGAWRVEVENPDRRSASATVGL